MLFFLYKCYYVLFCHFQRSKMEVAWDSAIILLASVGNAILLTLLHVLGALNFINGYIQDNNPINKKVNVFLWVILPLCVLTYYSLHFLIFNKAQASKTDGRSKRFDFEPNRRDKVICFTAVYLPLGLLMLYFALEIFVFQYNKTGYIKWR